MLCSRVRERLADYSVGIPRGREEREIRAHLAACAECRAELRAIERAVELVERHGALVPPAGLFHAVRNRIEGGAAPRERPAWWGFLYSRPARVAAMGVSIAAVLLGLLLPAGAPTTPTLPVTTLPGQGGPVASELASSIRQHAMSAGRGTLADRVAWEAMAQILTQEKEAGASRAR
jgi:anti-sigma factor RsiW